MIGNRILKTEKPIKKYHGTARFLCEEWKNTCPTAKGKKKLLHNTATVI